MLDILTVVHSFADTKTAARIRQTCRRLAMLYPVTKIWIRDNGDIYHYLGKKLHRLDGPALVIKEGLVWLSPYEYAEIFIGAVKSWYREGLEHREYHPSTTDAYNDNICYLLKGMPHREAGPSAICGIRKTWYNRGMIHRKSGPAINECRWYTFNKPHRLDAPAIGDVYYLRGQAHRICESMINTWIINNNNIR